MAVTVKLGGSGVSVCLISRAVLGSLRAAAAWASCNAHSGGAEAGSEARSLSNALPTQVNNSENPSEIAARRNRFNSCNTTK